MKQGKIHKLFGRKKKQFAVLLDPDKNLDNEKLSRIIKNAEQANVDYFFVGGSLISNSLDRLIERVKAQTELPVIIFPGHAIQVSAKADAILFLSLISGRNPEFLIGNHVISAPFIKKTNLEVIPTGYMLIESGIQTSVEYMSNSKPIPHNKNDIAVATALAGEMLGNKLIYLEAGSGAQHGVSAEMISQVKKSISVPLIVGGGLRTKQDISKAFDAGADIVVIGTAIENNPDLINRF